MRQPTCTKPCYSTLYPPKHLALCALSTWPLKSSTTFLSQSASLCASLMGSPDNSGMSCARIVCVFNESTSVTATSVTSGPGIAFSGCHKSCGLLLIQHPYLDDLGEHVA